MMLISGPAIAKLALRTRKWAHEHLRREHALGWPVTLAQLE
jgi:hypothetical protein